MTRVWAGYGGWELVEFCNGDGTETWKLLYLVIGTGIAQGGAGLSLVVAIIIIMIIIRVLCLGQVKSHFFKVQTRCEL